jgi:hypothetical protein
VTPFGTTIDLNARASSNALVMLSKPEGRVTDTKGEPLNVVFRLVTPLGTIIDVIDVPDITKAPRLVTPEGRIKDVRGVQV